MMSMLIYRASNGTAIAIHLEYPLYLLTPALVGDEVESLLDPLYREYLVFCLYLPHRVGVEILK
jgi:hypothetical protein